MDFDVFLSHNSSDKPAVRELKRLLAAKNLRVWLDEDELQPGMPWQESLEHAIKHSRSVAVLVGKDGLGPWEDEEMQGALVIAVRTKCPCIPVLLPGAPAQPELPMFLINRTWVDLRTGLTDQGLTRLVWGITGQRPENNLPAYTNSNQLTVAPTSTQNRKRSPTEYDDELVGRVATALEEAKPLTIHTLTLQMNELFNRGTFRFEPLRECLTQEWGSRLHAGMQTLELLRQYSVPFSELAPDNITYARLMDEVNGYCLAMANYLFEGPVAVSQMRKSLGSDEDFLSKLPPEKHFQQIPDDIDEQVDGRRQKVVELADTLKQEFRAGARSDDKSEPVAQADLESR
jgi:TIR domain